MSELFLGEAIDAATHSRNGTRIALDPSSLTTHGVIVGMTGSGKTGLGVVLLEEALLAGIPTLIIDPKGDLPNLLLTFPDLDPSAFAPWVEGEAPEAVAKRWAEGLASWGLGPDRIKALRDAATFTIYTPGSTAGVPLNLVGSLSAPAGAGDDPEGRADEASSVVSGLLRLVGIDSDPLSGREHILLANLIDRAWAAGQSLDLATLIAQVQDPPMRKMGVLELDTFFPRADRIELVLKLNGLLASPAFAEWSAGVALDIESLLWDRAADGSRGRPRASIVSIAHLSDDERQFAVTAVLSRLVTWMRDQPGTASLRVLVYFDEVMGFVPPTAMPPAKKPILTLMKQARAFGVGVVLATQNPVDLDYKAISNAGTWMVGRLQTERDRDRLLDGMRSAAGAVDVETISSTITGLAKREFVLHRASSDRPVVFTSRWALSYLRGPITRDQIAILMAGAPEKTADQQGRQQGDTAPPAPGPDSGQAPLADDETSVPPTPADGIAAFHVAPAAPWLADVGGLPEGKTFQAAVAARVRLLYDDDKADLRHVQEWEAIITPLGNPIDAAAAVAVDYDDRDLRPEGPATARYRLPEADIDKAAWWRAAEKAIKEHLVAHVPLVVNHNTELDLFARADESVESFRNRCETVADMKADEQAAQLRPRLEARIARLREAIDDARRRHDDAKADKRSSRGNEILAGAGDLISIFLGGRRRARSLGRVIKGASTRHSSAERAEQRAATAADEMLDKSHELEQLERELADQLFEIDAAWSEKAKAISSVEIPLERSDLTVLELRLCWIPVA